MKPLKQPKTYDEQVSILKSKDCTIDDDEFCKEKLAEINYYRLSAYFLPFRDSNDKYQGVSFYRVYQIYEFDRKLRVILLSALEEVEIFLRAKIAYYHARKYGADGYYDPNNYSKKHDHEKLEENISREIKSNKSAAFVRHHLEEYDGKFPIWVIVELFTFGMLSFFFSDLVIADQKVLARELYNTTPKNVSSWVRCCSNLRNICAHYGRLYFRKFSSVPSGIEMDKSAERFLWGAVLSLRALYPHSHKWNTEVLTELEALFEKYRYEIDLNHIAFPKEWAYILRK